jgi:hypothetical protein
MYRKLMLFTLSISVLITPSQAKSASRPTDLIVVEPKALPEVTRSKAQAMILHQAGNGESYLYLEQQQFARVVVLDVTDPAHIEVVNLSKVDAPAPFDFVRLIGSSVALIRYRNNLGYAILDLRKPKTPSLATIDVPKQATSVEPLGDKALMVIDELAPEYEVVGHDYQVIDASDPRFPKRLATIRLVRQKIEDNDTGTVFLLGADGLTVLRRPHLENEYRALSRSGN